MISKKKINYIHELQEIQRLATKSLSDVGLHSLDGSIMIDAKSYIGMFALDFNQPLLVVSEDIKFHESIKDVGENVD